MKKQALLFLILAVVFIAAGAAATAGSRPVKALETQRTGVVQKMTEGDNSFEVILRGADADAIVVNLDDAASNSDKALRLQDSLLEKRRVRVSVDAKNEIVDVVEL